MREPVQRAVLHRRKGCQDDDGEDVQGKDLHHSCEINSRSAPAGRLRKTNIFFDREVRQKTGRLKNESDAAGFRRKVDAARSAEDRAAL